MTSVGKVLLIGFGNPGRLDDGLGPALAEIFEEKSFPGLTIDSNYQLSVEDAASVAENDIVIFADASINGTEPFSFQKLTPKASLTFSTHSIEPDNVLGLAHELFKTKTQGYILGIRGYDFNEFGQYLSEKAKNNLNDAVIFLEQTLTTNNFKEIN
ncbi:MAG: hypothetical protein A2267_05685 [Omnitrophica WOR_2 bacterium RIFOXYA12_FULL_38_10]|nr:MAG: hypothetical protein A2267_05685 [Omnitrophica WOR_2 bacterium RIFOXYA12_FULL_38_10]